MAAFAGFAEKHEIKEIIMQWYKDIYFSFDVHFCPVHPRYVVSALRFLFVVQLISNLHTSIILEISSLSSKLGKFEKKVRMAAI